jgi:hypothetical protein
MGIFGVDVSNHQTSFDFTGWDFAFLKSSEGSGFKDRMFHSHLANARKAGCVVAAYHYVRTDPADYQVGNIESMVPKDVPIILDIEDGAGSDPNNWRQLIRELRERGYKVPLIYLPRWYWNKIDQPDLSGLPPIWMSWYPDYIARPREEGIRLVPGSAWASMDGIPVVIMQFTSSPFDQNFYGGTKDQLAALLGGVDLDMQFSDKFTSYDGVEMTVLQFFQHTNSALKDLYDKFNTPLIDSAEKTYKMSGYDFLRYIDLNGIKLDKLGAAVEALAAKVDAISTGGVDEERIGEIAVDAVKEELTDND